MPVTNIELLTGPYFPNGATTSFAFDFRALTKAELTVYRGEPSFWDVVDPALYSVEPALEEGGSVVFDSAPLTPGGPLYIIGDPDFQQASAFGGGEAPFTPKALNPELERAALRSAAVLGIAKRAITVPVGEEPPLPGSLLEAEGKALGVAGGRLVPLPNDTAAVASDVARAEAAANSSAANLSGAVGAATLAGQYRDQSGAFALAAEADAIDANNAKAEAQAARDAAALFGNMYPDTASGVAAETGVPDGGYFTVSGVDDVFATLYRNDAGVATPIAEYPTLASLGGTTEIAVDHPAENVVDTSNGRIFLGMIFPADEAGLEDLFASMDLEMAVVAGGETLVLEFFERPVAAVAAATTFPGGHPDDDPKPVMTFDLAAIGLPATDTDTLVTLAYPNLLRRTPGTMLSMRVSIANGPSRVAIGSGVYTDADIDTGPGALWFSNDGVAWAASNDVGFAYTHRRYVSPTQASEAFEAHSDRLGGHDADLARIDIGLLENAAETASVAGALTKVEKSVGSQPQTAVFNYTPGYEWCFFIPVGTGIGAVPPGSRILRIQNVVRLQAGAVLTRSIYRRPGDASWLVSGAGDPRDTLLMSDTSTIDDLNLVADADTNIALDFPYTAKAGDVLIGYFSSKTGANTPLNMGTGWGANTDGVVLPFRGYRRNEANPNWIAVAETGVVAYDVIGEGYEVPGSSGGGVTPGVDRNDTVRVLADLWTFASYGQSNGMGADALPLPGTTTPAGGLMFVNGERTWQGTDSAAVRHASLAPLVPDQTGAFGDTGLTGYDLYLAQLFEADGVLLAERGFDVIATAPAQGGASIAELSKGTDLYQRVVDAATFGVARAADDDRIAAMPSVGWTHGESAINSGAGAVTYNAAVQQLIDDLNADIKAVTGQAGTIPLIASQVASHSWYAKRDATIAKAQLDHHRAGTGFYLATPTYMIDYVTEGNAPGLHMTAEAQRIKKAYFALVDYWLHVRNLRWDCLRITGAVCQGRVVVLDTNAIGGLTLDTATVDNPGDHGFSVVTASGGAVGITSVEIKGGSQVRIVCDTAPGANARWQYGWVTQDMIDSGKALVTAQTHAGPLTGPRGTVRDNFGATVPVFDIGGINWPMHRWLPFDTGTMA